MNSVIVEALRLRLEALRNEIDTRKGEMKIINDTLKEETSGDPLLASGYWTPARIRLRNARRRKKATNKKKGS